MWRCLRRSVGDVLSLLLFCFRASLVGRIMWDLKDVFGYRRSRFSYSGRRHIPVHSSYEEARPSRRANLCSHSLGKVCAELVWRRDGGSSRTSRKKFHGKNSVTSRQMVPPIYIISPHSRSLSRVAPFPLNMNNTPKLPWTLHLLLFIVAKLVSHFLNFLWVWHSYLSKGDIVDAHSCELSLPPSGFKWLGFV
jgi:hypothetical protein